MGADLSKVYPGSRPRSNLLFTKDSVGACLLMRALRLTGDHSRAYLASLAKSQPGHFAANLPP